MARLPIQAKLQIEDVPGANRSWMSKMIGPLNQFMSEVVNGLNRNLTFQDNFLAQIKSISFTNSDTAFPLSFDCTLGQRPMSVKVLTCETADTTEYAGFVKEVTSWTYTQARAVQINSISGLTDNLKYTLTVLVF